MNLKQNDFGKNVFINCPFDDGYIALLRPLIFTIIYLGYAPKIATERSDSGEARIDKIRELIEHSKISIHDLSRIQSSTVDEFYRMNMPFELGLDFGCRIFKEGQAREKKCLILEKDKFRYQKALSDMAGSDIENHNNSPEEIVFVVRNWFVNNEIQHADGGTKIWTAFNEFMADLHQERVQAGFKGKDIEKMQTQEFIRFIVKWTQEKRQQQG